ERSAAQLTDGPATELLVATDFGRAWNSDGRRVSLFPLARLRLVALDLGDLDLLACLGAFVDLVAGFLWRAWGGEQVEGRDGQIRIQQVVEFGLALEDVHAAPRLLIAPIELGFEPIPPRHAKFPDLSFCFAEMTADLDHALNRLLAECANRGGVLGEDGILAGRD